MKSPLGTLVIGYRTRLATCQRPVVLHGALLMSAMIVALSSGASAQRVGGSMDVLLVILAPTPSQPVKPTQFRLDRDGMATIRTTALASSQTTRVVMTRVSSSTIGASGSDVIRSPGIDAAHYVPVPQCDARRYDCAARGVEHRVDVGRSESENTPRDVRLRLEYLIVPGT